MSVRMHRCLSILCLTALTFFLISTLQAQQLRDPSSSLQIEMDRSMDQFFIVDELGVQLSLFRFYESFLDIETYRLDTGDLLGISLEGNVSGAIRGLRVNSQGMVMIPHIGVAGVGGMLFPEAENLIRQKVQEKLTDTEAVLLLEHPRTLEIHVVGNIPYPGPQLAFSQTRLDQAVYRSFFQPVTPREDDEDFIAVPQQSVADPLSPAILRTNKFPDEFIERNEFTLRNILIQRKDGSQKSADLIRYLKTGELDANPIVEQGDIILINRFHDYDPRISVSGAVRRSLELEYRPDDTIDRLIRMAGGRTFDSADDYLRILRHNETGISEQVIRSPGEADRFTLSPNDRIIVPYDQEKRTSQSVRVLGEVLYSGRYPVQDGITTVYDLLRLSGGLTGQALPQAAYLIRAEPGKTEYGPVSDTLLTSRELRVQRHGNLFGSRLSFDPELLKRTSDQFEQGFEYLDLEAILIQNRVHIDLLDQEQIKSVRLFDGDRLHIPRNDGTVFVFGQVNHPGYFNFEEHQSPRDYIRQAGGFALSADEERIFIIKAHTGSWHRANQATLGPGDLLFVDRTPFDELQAARDYDLQKRAQRNSNIQLIMTGLGTITSIITAYIAVSRR